MLLTDGIMKYNLWKCKVFLQEHFSLEAVINLSYYLRPLQINYLVDGFIKEIKEQGGSMNSISTFFNIIVVFLLKDKEAGAQYI